MVKRTTQGRTYSGIKFKICSTMFLYSKEEQILKTSIELQKVEPVYNKGQDTVTLDRESNQQT